MLIKYENNFQGNSFTWPKGQNKVLLSLDFIVFSRVKALKVLNSFVTRMKFEKPKWVDANIKMAKQL
jgi:hypothetical protein